MAEEEGTEVDNDNWFRAMQKREKLIILPKFDRNAAVLRAIEQGFCYSLEASASGCD